MIYVDANATYPVAPEHYDHVARVLKEVDGNPSSIHAPGRNAKIALENARASVARLLGARPTEIVFTSGATEANNMVLAGKPGRIVLASAEHSSVKEPAKDLAERRGADVTFVPVARDARVDQNDLLAAITRDTALVCVMHANNEVGAINDVRALASAIKAKAPQVHVHVDAVQMLAKADLTWYASSAIDSASFSAHKIGAYKGVGALYLRSGTKLTPLVTGGGQERARRPGTENMPGIVSFGIRCDEVRGREAELSAKMRRLQELWLAELGKLPGVFVHGDPAQGLPNTVNFHADGVAGDDMLLNFDLAGIHASSGSACSSGAARPSPVLLAMGYDETVALNSVRISFHAGVSERDVGTMAGVLESTIARVRA